MVSSTENSTPKDTKDSEAPSTAIERLFEGREAKSSEFGVFLQPVGSTDTNPFPAPGTQDASPTQTAPEQPSSGTDTPGPAAQASTDDS